MTAVYCTAIECEYYKAHDEKYGICEKDHITLDERVWEKAYGCPDCEEQAERSE